ncbi:hypothetical protein D6D17_04559 [Aureobasidium pullulans]|uniref:Uncharacterized protein n=1 Tax=Aureobasidium pullulans TaxID=5580 RepID=A0A4T0EFW3_AURPU|nr:hypothetical protein D6D17_04559 [Aureobasidium pullulans]THY71509.1 hypothetical protein D6C94_07623 [Aureobasidium pullulans]THZ41038.1 hypothetical protein D6C87_05983 [Aureobasidium pullulans]TIA45099.1 hypothetical protein D6C79_05884 [Aureobasidium pullulans]TIA72824.1 hypothetical protein D6C76_06810 [Aureobasidium pullulans]
MPPTRKAHHKSRGGCVQCKKRHVKVLIVHGYPCATKYGQIVETALKEKQLAAFPRTNKVLRRVMKSQSLQLPPKLDSLYFLGSKNWN